MLVSEILLGLGLPLTAPHSTDMTTSPGYEREQLRQLQFLAHITKKKRELQPGHVLLSIIGVTRVFRHQYYRIQAKQTICEISQVRIQYYSCTNDRKTVYLQASVI